MPFWKIYHPVGAFTAEDKQALSQRITELYRALPKFYVIVVPFAQFRRMKGGFSKGTVPNEVVNLAYERGVSPMAAP